jgi:uncharacterized metal-binding protein YceD (DUF177 family)
MAVDSLSLTAQETREPLERDLVFFSGDADLLPADVEIHVWFRVVPCSGEAVVTGSVRASFVSECAVCLCSLEAKVAEDFSVSHRLLPNKGIDLLPDVRDAFMAGIPLQRKCSPECRGLCVKCGKNLNEGPCSCSSEKEPSPMKVILDEALERADSE